MSFHAAFAALLAGRLGMRRRHAPRDAWLDVAGLDADGLDDLMRRDVGLPPRAPTLSPRDFP